MGEAVWYAIVRCTTASGFRAWELVFTDQRVIAIKKSAGEALKIGATAGAGGAFGIAGAIAAQSSLRSGATGAAQELAERVQREGVESIARGPENVTYWYKDIDHVFLKDGIFGAPELRIIRRDGNKQVFGLFDTNPAKAHFEPLRSYLGPMIRHNKLTG